MTGLQWVHLLRAPPQVWSKGTRSRLRRRRFRGAPRPPHPRPVSVAVDARLRDLVHPECAAGPASLGAGQTTSSSGCGCSSRATPLTSSTDRSTRTSWGTGRESPGCRGCESVIHRRACPSPRVRVRGPSESLALYFGFYDEIGNGRGRSHSSPALTWVLGPPKLKSSQTFFRPGQPHRRSSSTRRQNQDSPSRLSPGCLFTQWDSEKESRSSCNLGSFVSTLPLQVQ